MTITIGGEAYHLALPFGLDVLEDAGDAIDRFRATAAEITAAMEAGATEPPMRLLAKGSREALEVFCIAINLQQPGAVDFAAISKRSSLPDATPLIQAINAALTGSGFAKKADDAGEPGARPAPSRSPSRRKSARSSRG